MYLIMMIIVQQTLLSVKVKSQLKQSLMQMRGNKGLTNMFVHMWLGRSCRFLCEIGLWFFNVL